MAFKKFKKLVLNPNNDLSKPEELLRVINQLQSNIENAVSPLVSASQNDSTILSGIVLVAGQVNRINHTLNKPLTKWIAIRVKGECRLWDSQDANSEPHLTLFLHTDTDVSVDLEVS